MPEHRKQQQLTGSERLLRRPTVIEILAGLAAALWLIPMALSVDAARIDEIILGVTVAGGCTMAVLICFAVRAQRRNAQWMQQETSRADHGQAQVALDLDAVLRLVVRSQRTTDDSIAKLRAELLRRVDDISGKLDRASWDIYADALTDKQGGPEAMNSEITKTIAYNANRDSNVVQFPQASRGAS